MEERTIEELLKEKDTRRLISMIVVANEKYTKALQEQKCFWEHVMKKTIEGHSKAVLEVHEKLTEKTITFKKELEFLCSLQEEEK